MCIMSTIRNEYSFITSKSLVATISSLERYIFTIVL
nr:MAG TPA: hypothetical protein [Caudoviricetes sp.]